MFQNRLALASALIIVVIVGGSIVLKLSQKPGETEDTGEQAAAGSIDVSMISEELLATSELYTEVLAPGSGQTAQEGDTVAMNYVGVLTDGTQFDSSYERGTPFQFTIGTGGVIKGWDQGIPGMQVGEKRRLIIPADLAYGTAGRTNIPPNSTLVFEVELVEIL